MAKHWRVRETLKRRSPRFDPRPRLLVCCGGKVTEPSYFNGIRREEQNRLLEVAVYASGDTPKTLVERAVEQKKEAERQARRAKNDFLKYDEVWCVFDVDEHPHLADAKQ